jgi:hypothetical protein
MNNVGCLKRGHGMLILILAVPKLIVQFGALETTQHIFNQSINTENISQFRNSLYSLMLESKHNTASINQYKKI